ncbi:hypothetical protein C2U70_30870 [Bradyrhizobium guangdongense]|nr:hypothetical protein C2U70_30870 [Bradyrhizobium guangdongense]
MQTGDLRLGEDGAAPPASTEVQFALVIARMLETVQNHPEHMRQVVYDLARYKLREQFSHADVRDIGRSKRALEVAIQGVEEFARQQVSIPPLSPPQVPATSLPASRQPTLHEVHRPQRPQTEVDDRRATKPRHSIWSVTKRAALLLILVGIAVLAVQQRERLVSLVRQLSQQTQQSATVAPPPTPAAPTPAEPTTPAKPKTLRPKDYGVYAAVDDTSLTALQSLPGRPPDGRVAISAAFKVPNQASLTNGHPKFIVFRRELSNNFTERAEVRVVAKIVREFSADASGKKPADGEDVWVIRNFSYPFRASPMPDEQEMYELHSEDPALELPPGNYALILKAQSYYFSVSGEITDPRQCIERVIAVNGTFYADCKKP